MVHLDANCHPGRARPDNVVARNQVTDVRFGSLADTRAALLETRFIAHSGLGLACRQDKNPSKVLWQMTQRKSVQCIRLAKSADETETCVMPLTDSRGGAMSALWNLSAIETAFATGGQRCL